LSFGASTSGWNGIEGAKLIGCWQVKVDKKKVVHPSLVLNETFLKCKHKKLDSKYLEVKIWKNMSLHLIYGYIQNLNNFGMIKID